MALKDKQILQYRKEVLDNTDKYKHYSVDALTELRRTLTNKLNEIRAEVKQLGLTANRRRFMPASIPQDILKKHTSLTKEIQQLEIELGIIRVNISKLGNDDNIFKELIKESLGDAIFMKFIDEIKRRNEGMPPHKVRVDLQDEKLANDLMQAKKTIKELNAESEKARSVIDAWVRQNEPEINKGDFFTYTKDIRTCLPTLSEMLKRKNKS